MPADRKHAPLEWGKCEVVRPGNDIVIWTYGKDVYTALKTAERLQQEHNISCAVVNARYLKPFDREALREFGRKMPVVTLEDHVLTGGLSSIAAETLMPTNHHGLHSFGWNPETPVPHGSTEEIRKTAGLDVPQLTESICSILRGK